MIESHNPEQNQNLIPLPPPSPSYHRSGWFEQEQQQQQQEARRHSRSGGDHAFVPLAVGHGASVVVAHAVLVGLFPASVQECLQGLSLAFGLADDVTGALRSETGKDR